MIYLLSLLIVIAFYALLVWFGTKAAGSKVIRHKESKVISIYGYKPQPGEVKIFNEQS